MKVKLAVGAMALALTLLCSVPKVLADPMMIPSSVATSTPPIVKVASSTPELVTFYASFYNVNRETMMVTLACENNFRNGQSRIPDSTGPNGYEDSWGVAQIHLPDHPEVTKAQALDIEFSIKWMAWQFSQGNQWMWTCYRKNYD